MNLHFARRADETLRVLCLGAHSDDIEIGCGGTILTLLEKYKKVAVKWVVFSANESRAQEARVGAAAFLRTAAEVDVEIKAYRDGFFPYCGADIKETFEVIKREFTPDVVFTHYRDDRHQDHRVISDLTWNTFRSHLILEFEIPKYDGDIGQPNFYSLLAESACLRKVETIITSFASQRQKQWFDKETFLAILRLRGMEANSATRFAEAFYCRKAVLGDLLPPSDVNTLDSSVKQTAGETR